MDAYNPWWILVGTIIFSGLLWFFKKRGSHHAWGYTIVLSAIIIILISLVRVLLIKYF